MIQDYKAIVEKTGGHPRLQFQILDALVGSHVGYVFDR
jgi:hypothetical protein